MYAVRVSGGLMLVVLLIICSISVPVLTMAHPAWQISTATSLVPGSSVVGQIEAAGERDSYTFFVRSGQGVQLSMWRGGASNLDPYLSLYAPDGSPVVEDDNGAGDGSSAFLRLVLDQTGEYTVVASGASGTTGAYGLELQFFTPQPTPQPTSQPAPTAAAPAGTPISPGSSIVGTINSPGESVTYAFTLETRQGVQFSMWRGGASTLDPYLNLYAPDGSLIAADDNGAGDGSSAFLRLILNQPGTYTLVASGANNTTGTYGLAMEVFAPDPQEQPSEAPVQPTPSDSDPTPTPAPAPQPGATGPATPLVAGVGVVGTIDAPDTQHIYSFAGSAEQSVYISMWPGGTGTIDPAFSLIGPDGAVVAQDDNGAGDGVTAYLALNLPSDGTYLIVASGVEGTTGTYGLEYGLVQ